MSSTAFCRLQKIERTLTLRCSADGVLVNFDPIYLTTEKLRDQLSEPKERQDNSDNDNQPDDINYAVHLILHRLSRKTTEFWELGSIPFDGLVLSGIGMSARLA